MTRWRTLVVPKLPRYGASLLALGLVAITWTVSGEQVKQPSERDARRISHAAPPDSATRQRCSSWMVCAAITSIATPRPCQP